MAAAVDARIGDGDPVIRGDLAFVVVTLLCGWAALAPVRRHLGVVAYHLLAFPVGLLGWAVLAALTSLAGVSWSLAAVALGLAAYALAVALGLRAIAWPDGQRGPVPAWTFAAWGAAVAVATLAAQRSGLYFATTDSWANYQLLGTVLHDTGAITGRLISERSLLVPAMHAGNLSLGGDWLYAAYPIVALHVAGLLGYALWRFSFAALPARPRGWLAGAVVACMAVGPVSVFMAFYVHSHECVALFLLLALVGLACAEDGREPAPRTWLAIAGFATAAFVLCRPDTLTYSFLVLVLATALFFRRGSQTGDLVAFQAPLLATLALAFGAAFVRLGVWDLPKLSGSIAAAHLAGIALVPVVWVLVARSRAASAWFGRGRRVLWVVLAADAVVLAALLLLKRAGFARAGRVMVSNLAYAGGWGRFWWFASGVVVVALLFAAVTRRAAFAPELLYALAQFAVFALVIHGAAHPGHLGFTDSFNRIAFHAVPLVWWLFGSLTGAALAAALPSRGRTAML